LCKICAAALNQKTIGPQFRKGIEQMKYGYSILLGEHIDAKLIDYNDCKSFQIVCPCCKEPIFKVRRDQKIQEINYLSHYEKANSYEADCELRVNSLNSSEIIVANAASRNQRIAYFLKVLRESVLKNEYGGKLSKLTIMFKQMEKSKTLGFIRDRFHEYVSSENGIRSKEMVYEYFDEYIKEFKEISGCFPKTGLSVLTQKRIAFDIWEHLLSANVRSNFDFMFNNSYLFLMFRIENARNVRKLYEFEELLYSKMYDLINKSKDEGMKIMASMMKYMVSPPHSLGLDLLNKMFAEINHEIFGCLLRVPYFYLLKKHNFNPE
jgi:hypothetical protein